MSITVCHSSYSVTTSLVIVTRSVDDCVPVMVMTGIADYLIVTVMYIRSCEHNDRDRLSRTNRHCECCEMPVATRSIAVQRLCIDCVEEHVDH
jgi:hypothetical protein